MHYFNSKVLLLLVLIFHLDQIYGRASGGGVSSGGFRGGRGSRGGGRSRSGGGSRRGGGSRDSRGSLPSSRSQWVSNSYTKPGYGSNYGTKFGSSSYKYVSKTKIVGLGASGGFCCGSSYDIPMYGIYDRYLLYTYLMGSWYYPYCFGCGFYTFYPYPPIRGRCYDGCPENSHCRYGLCECNEGFEQRHGFCEKIDEKINPYKAPADPFIDCSDSATCFKMDINLVCNSALGKCACRDTTRWKEDHCELYIDVDCSNITYETPPSTTILGAANKTMKIMGSLKEKEVEDLVKNETSIEARLKNSLLSSIDKDTATEDEIKEAFCRDVDAFSVGLHSKSTKESTATVGLVIGALILVNFIIN